MLPPPSCAIRRFHPSDLPALYRICQLTGFNGRDASPLVVDPDLVGHIYVGPYAVLDPLHAFVAVAGAEVVGYVVAAHDSAAFHARCEAEWFPVLRERYAVPLVEDGSLGAELIRAMHRGHVPFAAVDLAAYPAHLHINLLEAVRGQGLGRALIDELFAALRREKIPGVYLGAGVGNTSAHAFYERIGFQRFEADPSYVGYTYRLNDPP